MHNLTNIQKKKENMLAETEQKHKFQYSHLHLLPFAVTVKWLLITSIGMLISS